ncbi:MAG TPA: DHA2 family efflux MFS transporter permease subunit [Trebonia sp.]
MTASQASKAEPRDGERIGWPAWRLAWVIVLGAFASGLDTSLVNVGLNTIGTDLHAALPVVQWTATGYLLALAGSLPLAGWLGARVGVSRLWLAALAAFTLASAACALAPSIAALIGLRVVQGLAGGLLIPAGQTVLGQAVVARRLGRVMATLGVAVTAAPALGPVIGGLLLHAGSWRWLFAINLPIGGLGLLLGWRYIPRGHARTAAATLDWPALVGISAGLPLLIYGFTEISGHPSLPRVLLPLLAGAAALTGFVIRSRRSSHPLIDLTLLRSRTFTAATVASGTTGMLMFGSGLLFPLYFQLGRHDTTIATGLHLLGLAGATAAVLPLTGRLVDRHGGGRIATIGAALALTSIVPFAILPTTTSPVAVHALLAVLGVAIAFAAVPPGIVAYKTVTPDQLADATTTVNIVQRVGGALGGALFALVLANTGLHAAFWTMAATGLAALASTAWLAAASRQTPPGP